ncbi:Ppx/GppA phosphatase family protein [Streptomyces sp. NBC_01497]|uniref:Ppx/GppA phosphatase family protein n=1 Tax=Streptomyces sp. NBC_01497 TaxID=2903885 RepID=UPI002E36CB89|nr:Ppx/GppA family phosphatase [Streptomyces sp. NBC_01497]
MRVAVVDVGSTSAHVDVVELRKKQPPRQSVTVKHKVTLSRDVGPDGRIREKSMARLVRAVGRAADTAALHGAEEMVAFATSVVRDAPNRDAVLARVAAASGVRLGVLTPRQEARLTYEGARAWRRPGRDEPLLVADIGGGTFELALGTGSRAGSFVSSPLGARRLTLAALPGDPPSPHDVARLRRYLAREVPVLLKALGRLPEDIGCVGASRVFAQLATVTADIERPAGGDTPAAAVSTADLSGPPTLDLGRLRAVLPDLAAMTWQERAERPGVSRARAPHILAGALLAEALMDSAGIAELPVCPWGLREGIALRLRAGLEGDARSVEGLDRLRQHA